MDNRKKKRRIEWITKLNNTYPEKFGWKDKSVLRIDGCDQYCFASFFSNDIFFDYSLVNKKNIVYRSDSGIITFEYWKDNRYDINEPCKSYKDLEKKALRLYDYVQKTLKEMKKEERIKKIKAL